MNQLSLYTAENLYELITQEIDNFDFVPKENQIFGIIYYVNSTLNYNIDLTLDEHVDFILNISEKCINLINNTKYKDIQENQTKVAYIAEVYKLQTLDMLNCVMNLFKDYSNLLSNSCSN
jgi:hypothetical protein